MCKQLSNKQTNTIYKSHIHPAIFDRGDQRGRGGLAWVVGRAMPPSAAGAMYTAQMELSASDRLCGPFSVSKRKEEACDGATKASLNLHRRRLPALCRTMVKVYCIAWPEHVEQVRATTPSQMGFKPKTPGGPNPSTGPTLAFRSAVSQ